MRYILAILGIIVSTGCIKLPSRGEANKINRSNWSGLRKGMTPVEVTNLLGVCSAKTGASHTKFDDGSEFNVPAHWEYDFTNGFNLFGKPHEKAYVIYFDKNNLTSNWRLPVDKMGTK